MQQGNIRNFVIIAHIDHGKSTLADRFLELTGTVSPREFREQFLDQMDIERERGITIKMQPVRMIYHPQDSGYILNLIDTPGHVDFSYEVSRSLAAVEGAILLVDGTQGIQAQTLSHLQEAKNQGLKIVGAINKVDLPIPNLEALASEIAKILQQNPENIFQISAKTGKNVALLLEALMRELPPSRGRPDKPLRALIFDSHYDPYRGVIAYVRIFDGKIETGSKINLMASGYGGEALEVGVFSPHLSKRSNLSAGEIGYIATGIKEPGAVRVGDTICQNIDISKYRVEPLPGYQEPIPMVFAGFYVEDADMLPQLREALAKLKLNDASLSFEPDRQELLGQGFRIGFLGTLHLEITKERFTREYGIEPIITTPSVRYKVLTKSGDVVDVFSPQNLPSLELIQAISEPWVSIQIITPSRYMNSVMKLIQRSRGNVGNVQVMTQDRLLLAGEMPLAEMILGFYDVLKGISQGYASMSYTLGEWKVGDLVRLNILIAGKAEPGLARIIPKSEAERIGRATIEKLKEILPRQLFPVPLQAAVESRILARETIPALKKDVTGYLYGGDRTRKMKLWKKQQKGKKKLAEKASLRIPNKVFFELFKMERGE